MRAGFCMPRRRKGRITAAVALFLLPAMLSGCQTSAGLPADGFVTPAIARAYLTLEGPAYLVLEGHAAGVVIRPGIAVTNAHNSNLVDRGSVIGVSADYDLLFFRTPRHGAPPMGAPGLGRTVVAYGAGTDGSLRMARGPVRWLDAPVLPRCEGCPTQHAFAFEAEGGKGFSGGPVVDAKNGRLIGIVFGFRDGMDDRTPDARLMYAYPMKLVFAELARIRTTAAVARRRKNAEGP